MLKKYVANSHVAFSVVLPSGKNTRVSFSPLTGGGSVYYCDSETMQAAIEGHPKFNRLFRLGEVIEKKQEVKINEAPVAEETKVVTVEVSSLNDAKDYLVENFDLSRTRLRTKKQIEEAAAANGVSFAFS